MKQYFNDDITGKTSNLNSHKIIEEVLKDLKEYGNPSLFNRS